MMSFAGFLKISVLSDKAKHKIYCSLSSKSCLLNNYQNKKRVSLRDFFAEKIVAIQFCRKAKHNAKGVVTALQKAF